MCLKGIWCCSFHGQRNFGSGKFLVVNTWRGPVRKWLKASTLNLAHISNTLPHKTVPAFFLIMCYSFFTTLTFHSFFYCITVKSRLFKKYLKRRKSQARFCLSFGWLHISEKTENCKFVGTGAQKVEKVVSFWPNFDPNCTNIWRA